MMFRAFISLPASFEDQHITALTDDLLDNALAQTALRQGNHLGPWVLDWFLEEKPDLADLTARLQVKAALLGHDLSDIQWTIETVNTDTDWLADSYQAFPPFSVGPFYIYGSHYADNPEWDGVPDGLMGLQIDAATAFGSGEHGTTKGCLQAMLDLKGAGICPWNVLDMGTGSGILAIAAWKLWKTPILAVDIDAESVRVTEHHAALNGVNLGGSALSTQAGDGFSASLIDTKKPYELVIANILAAPLIDMAGDLAAVVDKPGYVILSGMLVEQAESVLEAYKTHGLHLKDRYDIGEWTSLLLRR
jgi:ribosomal protein L11 methyltransferase